VIKTNTLATVWYTDKKAHNNTV